MYSFPFELTLLVRVEYHAQHPFHVSIINFWNNFLNKIKSTKGPQSWWKGFEKHSKLESSKVYSKDLAPYWNFTCNHANMHEWFELNMVITIQLQIRNLYLDQINSKAFSNLKKPCSKTMQLHTFMNPLLIFIHKQHTIFMNIIIQEFIIDMERLSLKQIGLRKLLYGEQFSSQL